MAVIRELTHVTLWPLFLIIGLAAWSLTAASAKGQTGAENHPLNVSFTATPVKKHFEIGEKILFSFSLRNEGQRDIALVGVFIKGFDVHMEITGPDGRDVRPCGAIPLIGFEELSVLHPGELLEDNIDIRCDEEDGIYGFSFVEPGKYRMTAKYSIPRDVRDLRRKAPGTATVAKGPFEAEPVEFWLVPKGSEEDTSISSSAVRLRFASPEVRSWVVWPMIRGPR